MVFRFSCPHTSSQNGKAERKIRAINNIIRTLLAHSSMPPSFWHHALSMATYILNILPSKIINNHSPTQVLYTRNPTYSHLRVFGCLCYPLFPSTTINKLQPRSTPCIFLGYPPTHRGYKCYDLQTKKIIVSRHVTFDETKFPFASANQYKPEHYNFLHEGIHPSFLFPSATDPIPPNSPHSSASPPSSSRPVSAQQTSPSQLSDQNHSPHLATSSPPQPRSISQSSLISRPRNTPPRSMTTRSMSGISKRKTPFNLSVLITPSPLPRNPKDALSNPNWKHAMTDEFNALTHNNTWELVP